MAKSWDNFEKRVREMAENVWGRPCKPQRVGGVNIDGVVILDAEIQNFIEITEDRTLGKVREDVVKLQTAKASAFTQGVLARCFCVVNGPVTQAMKEAGAPHHIQVLSIDEFTKLFFDFSAYRAARARAPFGSSVNPLTGETDETQYVPVRYLIEGKKGDVSSSDIANFLISGRTIILVGEYGSGKSRCIREVFSQLAEKSSESFCYPLAIDLRQCWGLKRSGELLRRHFAELGLDRFEGNAVRAFRTGAFALLLDGFDEIGSQSWSNDGQRLKAIRAKSLEGVKEIISQSKGGILISGREHYFPSQEEMFASLGLDPDKTLVIRSKNEFSDSELLEYFQNRDIEVDIPEWLPRRPLICQTISDLAADQFAGMFGDDGNEISFWNHFIRVLCERDARIHASFDPETIRSIFIHLARLTRSKPANVGPISLTELQNAFEAATGAVPVEEASVMLQRLPSLGRISAESNDRQFVDVYILDGLRAQDIISTCLGADADFNISATAKWTNPLDDLGQRILASDGSISENSKLDFARRCIASGNTVMASDIVGCLLREQNSKMDFMGMAVVDGDFRYLTFSEREIANLTISDSYIGELVLPAKGAKNVAIVDCMTPRVSGVTAPSALPGWIRKLDAEEFDSVESVSRIRKIGLQPSHEILITIIRKTFFQKGSGRKEEALLRGLGNVAAKSMSTRILNILIREGLLTKFRGDEGEVYAPVRSYTSRMQAILNELKSSSDPLWIEVGKL